MTSKQLFDAGNLSGAIESLVQEVKANPMDAARRTFLFELLAFGGEYQRAAKQLETVAHLDENPQNEWATQVYMNLLNAEQLRGRLYREGLKPQFLLDPPAYVQLHLDAINLLRENRAAEAQQLLDQSAEARSAVRGQSNGQPIDDFRDYDDVLAPVLELILIQDYIWLPLDQVTELEISRPERPRDLLWTPVRVALIDGTQRRAYMPALYWGSHENSDDRIKLGRMTDWKVFDDGPTTGIGQREFLVGGEEQAMLELQTLTFTHAS